MLKKLDNYFFMEENTLADRIVFYGMALWGFIVVLMVLGVMM